MEPPAGPPDFIVPAEPVAQAMVEDIQQTSPSPAANPELAPEVLGTPRAPRGLRSVLSAIRLRLRRAPSSAAVGGEAAQPDVGAAKIRDFNPIPSETSAAARSAAEIFREIGEQLRVRREMLSLTYEEIERHTHVRAAFLSALERGSLEDLPSPVQTRGILDNYAKFLDLDADSIMLRFADALQAQYREKGPVKPTRTRAPMTVHTTLPPLRAFIASDLVFGGGLAVLLLLFAIWGISRVLTVRSETAARVTPPSISEVLAGTALPTLSQQVTVIPAENTALPVVLDASPTLELATLAPNVQVAVELTSSERAYLRVMVDGKLKFEGRTEVGTQYTYQAKDQVEIVTGNAAAIRVTYNQQDLGLMGNFGQVVDRLYTAAGVATPTATPQPTRTPTPKVTVTPSITPTTTPSVTPTPKTGG